MSTANDNRATYTVDELAARWRVGRNSVIAAIREGKLHAFKVGKRVWRITAAEVERYEAARNGAA